MRYCGTRSVFAVRARWPQLRTTPHTVQQHRPCGMLRALAIKLDVAYQTAMCTAAVQWAQTLRTNAGVSPWHGFFDLTDAATPGSSFDQCKSGCAAIGDASGHVGHAPASRSRRAAVGPGRHPSSCRA